MDVYALVPLSLVAVLVIAAAGMSLWRRTRRSEIGETAEGRGAVETSSADRRSPDVVGDGRLMVVIGEPENPVMTIKPFDAAVSSGAGFKEIPANPQNLATLQEVFRHVPALGQSVLSMASKSYLMTMSPEAATGLASGSLDMMKAAGGGFHGDVVDVSTGKVVEKASFTLKSVSKAAMFAAVFQVLSFATAQYYLFQINRRLALIEGSVNDLREHLEASDRAALTTSVRHLKTMSAALEGRELSEADFRSELVGLNGIDHDCARVLEANREHMRRYRGELDEIKLAGILAPDIEAASGNAEKYERAALTVLQAAYVRIIVARFRCIVPSDYRLAYTQGALRELTGDLAAMREEHVEYSARFEERIRADATASLDFDPLRELLGSEDTVEESRRGAVSAERGRLETVSGLRDELDGVVEDVSARIDRQITAGAVPLSLVVTVDEGGEIVSLAELNA